MQWYMTFFFEQKPDNYRCIRSGHDRLGFNAAQCGSHFKRSKVAGQHFMKEVNKLFSNHLTFYYYYYD